MTAEWERVEQLFHAALERPAAEREGYVRQVAGEDRALAGEVVSLLEAITGPGPLGHGDFGRTAHDPERVERFRIERRVGEGGMSVVYLAEREGEGFSQRVALKIARAGYTDPALSARLASERRILARLEHPGIARLIDGGTTSGGQPFFAMEFVEGVDLLTHARRQKLSLRDRILLFLEVCEAVQYAHQQLVVHRDLKPSNILVTGSGKPKLLDFGIATILDRPAGDGAAPWLTPSYASPEQAWGDPVGVLSAVYSLGVVLYELLAERKPSDPASRTPTEIAQVIRDFVPPPPSQVAAHPAWRSDLDAIVMKAIAKLPAERYQSVAELAGDLERYRTGQPVRAFGGGRGYRLRKFLGRHAWSVMAAGLAVLGLVGGLGAAIWQASEARQALRQAERSLAESDQAQAVLYNLFESNDPVVSGGPVPSTTELMEQGLERARELSAQPALQAKLLTTIGRVFLGLGAVSRSTEVLEQAVRSARIAFGDRSPALVDPLRHLGRSLRDQARFDRADSCYEAALSILEAQYGHQHVDVATVIGEIGRVALDRGDNPEGERLTREALAIRRSVLGPRDPGVGDMLINLGAISRRMGRYEEARSEFAEALDIFRESYGSWHPQVAVARLQLAMLLRDQLGDPEQARLEARRAAIIQRRTLGAANPGRTWSLMTLALTEERLNHLAPAESLMQEAIDLKVAAYGPAHPTTLSTKGVMAMFLARHGRGEEALRLARDGVAQARRWPDGAREILPETLTNLGRLLLMEGRPAEAERYVLEARSLYESVYGPDHARIGGTEDLLADLSLARGDTVEAARHLREAYRISSLWVGLDHPTVKAYAARLIDMGQPISRSP